MKSDDALLSALLVENGVDEGHAGFLHRHLANATHFICIVAFAKISGWNMIKEIVAAKVAKGLKVTFVVGIDFFQSDPEVLRALLRLGRVAKKSSGEVAVYMGQEASPYTLHPKVYWLKGRDGQALVVGSANMTSGGLVDNHELSAALSVFGTNWQSWLMRWIDDRIADGDIVEAKGTQIDRYEKRREIYRAAMKVAERRARRSMEAPAGQIISLNDLLAEMRADDGPEGFAAQVGRRKRNHRYARTRIVDLVSQADDLKRREFLVAYEALIQFWHSGGLQRGKTWVAKKPAQFQAALRALAAERSQDPASLFELLAEHFCEIPRAGTNVLTEILHTRDPKRFPVMNRNSVAGMRLANITGYPQAPSKATVNGALYARFAADAEALRQSLGLRDLGELDVLFNFAYWKRDEAINED
ncbi:phospholipase D-like domain-containing protein [Pseudaminobacter sp. NGMCC 1.201702]|uniref:phospholipase D-like domain-containing protein n=1 Tax=Pseudaminobacter sp. NGMCC 1.201702 TaxID=3391825 RepID=UPI0039EFEE8D